MEKLHLKTTALLTAIRCIYNLTQENNEIALDDSTRKKYVDGSALNNPSILDEISAYFNKNPSDLKTLRTKNFETDQSSVFVNRTNVGKRNFRD